MEEPTYEPQVHAEPSSYGYGYNEQQHIHEHIPQREKNQGKKRRKQQRSLKQHLRTLRLQSCSLLIFLCSFAIAVVRHVNFTVLTVWAIVLLLTFILLCLQVRTYLHERDSQKEGQYPHD